MSAQIIGMTYQRAFRQITESSETPERDLVAGILLDAVEQSFTGDTVARRWLQGVYAQSLLLLLDINPVAALEHLSLKWLRIDGGYGHDNAHTTRH